MKTKLLILIGCLLLTFGLHAQFRHIVKYQVKCESEEVISGQKFKVRVFEKMFGNGFWVCLYPVDFDDCFRSVEYKYAGFINDRLEGIADWRENIWRKCVPEEIEEFIKSDNNAFFNVSLYVNKKGYVFAAKYGLDTSTYKRLKTLPDGLLAKFHNSLIGQRCKEIEKVGIVELQKDNGLHIAFCNMHNVEMGSGTEYTILFLSSTFYKIFGTQNVKEGYRKELKKIEKRAREKGKIDNLKEKNI